MTNNATIALIADIELSSGDEIKDFRGDTWKFRQVTRLAGEGHSAKVEVESEDSVREFYADVFPELVIRQVKALNWRQIAALSTEELEKIDDNDEYDSVTQELANNELENRAQEEYEASEHQAAYDDFWRS